MSDLSARLFILLQHLLPQHLLSRAIARLAECRIKTLKNALIKLFIHQYDVNMSEAVATEPEHYACFNDFFTRRLKPDARPLADAERFVLHPADGSISQLGAIEHGRIFQAKGQDFSALELLGGDNDSAVRFSLGQFATIYLSPKDYHRVHMPVDGTLLSTLYLPGDLFSVNQTTAEKVPRLFARNERLVCIFETSLGRVALVMVGALIVAGIETVWGGRSVPRKQQKQEFNGDIKLTAGEELGRFFLGSTVILLFEKDSVVYQEQTAAGATVRMGSALATKL